MDGLDKVLRKAKRYELTDLAVRKVRCPEDKKRVEIRDSKVNGLILRVRRDGGKQWVFKYRIAGKRREMGLGAYPHTPLAEARERAEQASELLRHGKDPIEARRREKEEVLRRREEERRRRKEEHRRREEEKRKRREEERKRQERTFARLAMRWFEWRRADFPGKERQYKAWLENDVFPAFGDRPIEEITKADVSQLIGDIVLQGKYEKAKKTLSLIKRVFEYAVDNGIIAGSPAAGIRPKNLIPKKKKQNLPRIKNPDRLGELLVLIDGYPNLIIRNALLMLAYTFVRPGELRFAQWSEFDLHERLWRIPAHRMKMRRDHLVPLSRQVLAILDEMRPLSGGEGLVFPGMRPGRPLSDNMLNKVLRSLGIDTRREHYAHGFRGTASTLLAEKGWPSDVIEKQLAHAERSEVKAAYNHAEHLDARRKMMQEWADYLDTLRRRAAMKVVP